METSTYIDTLLKKYHQAPSFPFVNWATDAVDFYAMMNLWDDIFQTAMGQAAADYVAASDVKMDPESQIYDVRTKTGDRAVSVFAEENGGTFHILWSDAVPDFAPGRAHEGVLPDRARLGFATDIQRDRLIAAFEIMRAFAKVDLSTEQQTAAFEKACVERYSEYFGFDDYDPFATRKEGYAADASDDT